MSDDELMSLEAPPDFYLSAPMRMRTGGQLLVLRPTIQNEVLAFLLARANIAVPVTELAAGIWPDPRANGIDQIRPYIAKLRRLVAGTGTNLVNRRQRYLVEIEPMRVDVLRFDRLLAKADSADDPAEQRHLVDAALAACPPDDLLRDFTRMWAHGARNAHRARWQQAALRRNSYWLRDGLHERLLDILNRSGVAQLTDGQWVADYLLALYRCGRRDDALEHFATLEGRLRAQGRKVSERLRQLAEAIRHRDRSLDPAPQTTIMGNTLATPSPNMLPPPAGPLVGRHEQIKSMREHADLHRHDQVRVIGIFGPPGIGKTALATGYAHLHQARYPGGVLYADFGAFSARTTIATDTVLTSFLGALGVTGDLLPAERHARVARYRDVTRTRPILVVLDNVAATSSTADLLPTAPGSLVLVTSRNRMTTLTSRYGAQAIVLGALEERYAVELLDRFVHGRPDQTVEGIARIARTCAGHPLALCLAGARIATRPEEAMDAVAAALADPSGRMAALDEHAEADDAVADVFGWSYRALDPVAASAFRAFGVTSSPSLGTRSVAELAGLPPEHLQPVLDGLESAHLVSGFDHGRYAMQDLLAQYARALALADGGEAGMAAALDRLYAYHRQMVRAAAHQLWPNEFFTEHGIFDDKGSARAWLDRHRDEVLAAIRDTGGQQRPEHVLELSACLFRYLDHGGHLDEAVEVNRASVAAATAVGDPASRAATLTRLGAVLVRVGRFDEADGALRNAQELYDSLGDRRGYALVLGNLGRAAFRRGELAEARRLQQNALAQFRASKDRLGEARTLINLGVVCEKLAEESTALRHYEDALMISREIGAMDALARALGSTAGVYRCQGRFDEARRSLEEAFARFRDLGDRVGEATTLTNLGLVKLGQSDPRRAALLHERALDAFDRIGDRPNVTETLNNLGDALLADGSVAEAVRRYQEASASASVISDQVQLSRGHAGLCAAYAKLATGSDGTRFDYLKQARYHLAEAVSRHEELGLALPEDLRAVARTLGEADR